MTKLSKAINLLQAVQDAPWMPTEPPHKFVRGDGMNAGAERGTAGVRVWIALEGPRYICDVRDTETRALASVEHALCAMLNSD